LTIYEADWVCPGAAAPIRHGAIAVQNGQIAAVGPADDLNGSPRVRYPGCAIIPGFVNAHAHLELTILRGFLEDLPFMDWILRLVRAKYQSLTRDALKVSAQLGALEMLRAGVTTVAEVMDVGAGWEALKEFGLQGVAYQEVFGPADSVAAESMSGLRSKVERRRAEETETLKIGVSPHAPFTVSRTLYEATRDYARSQSLPMTAHIAESQDELLLVRDGDGPFAKGQRNRGIEVTPRHCTPVAYLDNLGLLGPDMLLIHVIQIEDQDLNRLQTSRTTVVHCPKSNAKLGNRIARVTDMRARGVPVSLGTDSVASNNVVDMFEEMRAAVFYQRSLAGRVNALTAADAFRMATIEGARCLGFEARLGSLDAGKRADFVVVDLSGPATQPVYDPIETMVYSACRSNVRCTFLAGHEVDLDDSEILKQAQAIGERLRSIV
jgi:cytosine/adenosine deaminase-related metal-dependent hydrolase